MKTLTTTRAILATAALAAAGCWSSAQDKTPAPVEKPVETETRPVETKPARSKVPLECLDYKAAVEALAKCDKLPQETRDALLESVAQTAAAWADVPADGVESLRTACKSAAEAIKESAAACGN